MQSMGRFVLGIATLTCALVGFRAAPEASEMMGFGVAVLVGDGEVFVGSPRINSDQAWSMSTGNRAEAGSRLPP